MSQRRASGKLRISLILGIILAVMLSLPSGVHALGITPGMKTIDFTPNLKQTFDFTILNNEHKKFDAVVSLDGKLRDYVKLDKEIIHFDENMDSYTYRYSVEFPKEVGSPGENIIRIIVTERLPESENVDGSVVIATTAVAYQLKVKVPYPGKFAKTDLRVGESGSGGTTVFYVKAYNLGKQDINRAYASIDILGPTNEKIITLESEGKPIKSKTTEEFIVPWTADVNPGMYHAVVTLRYDDKIARAERNFGVGNLKVDVRSITVKDYRLGGVARFSIDIESKWNERISGVYAEMTVLDSNDDVIASFKSASEDIGPMGRATLQAYWDTEGVDRGTYRAVLKLHYSGQVTERELEVTVNFDSIDTRIPGLAGAVVRVGSGGVTAIDPSIVLLIFALVGINAGWFLYFRKRKG